MTIILTTQLVALTSLLPVWLLTSGSQLHVVKRLPQGQGAFSAHLCHNFRLKAN